MEERALNQSDFHVAVLPNRPIADVARIATQAEQLGFGGFWVADSQSIFRDAWQALALCAQQTTSLLLATGVTNPVTRHPAVIAGAIATLDEASGGRAILGIGVGESAVRTAGLKRASLARLEDVTVAIRKLLAGETALLDGAQLSLTWRAHPVPIWFASSGPRSLELAARVCDGVLFQVGSHPDLVRYAIEHIERGAESAGRDPAEIKRYARLACTVDEDGARAREAGKGYVAAAAGTVYSAVPRERMPEGLWQDLERMKERYDYSKHASGDADHASLITDRILDAIAVAGTATDALPRLREMLALGVDGFVVPVTTGDPEAELGRLAELLVRPLLGAAA